MAETVRIDPASHASLVHIAKTKGVPLSEALALAIKNYRLELMIAAMHADYAALRADPSAWAEEMAERELWDTTSSDGLENEPPYPLDGLP